MIYHSCGLGCMECEVLDKGSWVVVFSVDVNFVLGHTSGTAEQGTDRNGGIIESRTEGNFMYLKFVNLIMCNSGDVFLY